MSDAKSHPGFGVYFAGSNVTIGVDTSDFFRKPRLYIGYPDGNAKYGKRFETVGEFNDAAARDAFIDAMESVVSFSAVSKDYE